MAVGRRMFMKGAAAVTAAAGQMSTQNVARESALRNMAMPMPASSGYANTMTGMAPSNMPHIPDEVWELREQFEGGGPLEHNDLNTLARRIELHYEALRSIKPQARARYAQRDALQRYQAVMAERDTIMNKMQEWCDRLNIHNPFGRSRNKRRDSRFW